MFPDRHLWKYVDGALPTGEAEAVARAEQTDAALRRRIGLLRAARDEMLAGAPSPSPGFADRVAGLAARGLGARIVDLEEARLFLRRALIAAAILAAVGLAFLAVEMAPDWLGISGLRAEDPLLPGR